MRKQRKVQLNQGYTMVELIVTIVLIMILSSGAVFGVAKFASNMNYRRQNEAAQALFIAAQNQLVEYSESGQLNDFKEVLRDEEGEYIGLLDATELYDREGSPYDLESLWPASVGKLEPELYQGNICSLIGTPEDFAAYKRGEADPQTKALYDLFRNYLADTSLLDATICVELTPEDGQVFSVFYSDMNSSFTYIASDTTRGNVSIQNRKYSVLKDKMIGYYGVSELYQAFNGNIHAQTIKDVILKNEDTLSLNFSFNEMQEQVHQMVYDIIIYDKATKKELLSIELNAKNYNLDLMSGNFALISCPVYIYQENEEGKRERTKLDDFNFNVSIDSDCVVHMILDAVDLAATTSLYQYEFEELIIPNTEWPRQNLEMRKTQSFHRFGVVADNIYCTVSGKGEGLKQTSVKKSNTTNLYFGSYTGDETTSTYTIKNPRHFYNMRYLEDYDDRSVIGYKTYEDKDVNITYLLDKNFDWEEFVEDDHLYNNGQVAQNIKEFPSMLMLKENSVFKGNKGNTYTISGLQLTNNIYEDFDENEGINNFKDKEGLFIVNRGLIQDINLDNVKVQGSIDVGAFCAVDEGQLNHLSVLNSEQSEVSGKENVGGVFGRRTNDNPYTYENLYNEAFVHDSVENAKNIGGIVGYMNTESTLKDCSNEGKVRAINNQTQNIGGIVGYIDGTNSNVTLNNCMSSPRYDKEEIQKFKTTPNSYLVGLNVGGIVGKNESGQLENCSTSNSEDNTAFIFGNQNVGGIIGLDDTLILDGNNKSNEINVIGNEYVGGIVGRNDTSNREIQNWINKGFVTANIQYAGGITGYNGKTISDINSVSQKISDCRSDVVNDIVIVLNGNYIGGIAGYNAGEISNSKVEQDLVKVAGQDYVGGITGMNTGNITNSNLTLNISQIVGQDYVGGLVGYNSGTISNNEIVENRMYVTGNNFVGGAVGYNFGNESSLGKITNVNIAGGSIYATGNFVGGFIGINLKENLFADSTNLMVSLEKVEGINFVGGIVGGILAKDSQKSTISVVFDDVQIGEIKGSVGVGGVVGYSYLVKETGNNKEDLENLVASLKNVGNPSTAQECENVKNAIDSLIFGKGNAQLFLRVEKKNNQNYENPVGSVYGKIYVAGVVGYSNQTNTLQIENYCNAYNVEASMGIGNGSNIISYAGGIIGQVANNKVDGIVNCTNANGVEIKKLTKNNTNTWYLYDLTNK